MYLTLLKVLSRYWKGINFYFGIFYPSKKYTAFSGKSFGKKYDYGESCIFTSFFVLPWWSHLLPWLQLPSKWITPKCIFPAFTILKTRLYFSLASSLLCQHRQSHLSACLPLFHWHYCYRTDPGWRMIYYYLKDPPFFSCGSPPPTRFALPCSRERCLCQRLVKGITYLKVIQA